MPIRIEDEELMDFFGSYTGCNGGNPQSDLWICAIEHGGETDEKYLKEEKKLKSEFPAESWDEKLKKKIESENHGKKFEDISGGWPLERRIAKLLMLLNSLRMHGHATTDIGPLQYKPYMRDHMYAKNGDCFRLNLFPLSDYAERPPRSLFENYRGLHPVLEDKEKYREYCRLVRFPFFQKEIVRLGKPKVILGIGIGRSKDFANAFGFEGKATQDELHDESGRSRRMDVYRDGTSTLLVVPFFGGYAATGITSNRMLVALARKMNEIESEHRIDTAK